MKETIVVAMSGGVDSSTSAYLLKEQGYNVIGATMRLMNDDKTIKAINDAKDVCNTLGIKHYIFELVEDFKNIVINNFIESYKKGQTPNPCVVCNKFFKFGKFYELAKDLGADYIATGHYAKIENGKLKIANSKQKDQSYFLYGINKEVLTHIIFPLENYPNKDEVREIAKKADLSISQKKDSQEVCFVPNDDYKTYLRVDNNVKTVKGNIELVDGTVLGKHQGLINYTIGQRKGLNISYKEPLYVIDINTKENKLVVGPNESLFHTTLYATNINFLVDDIPTRINAKVRSRSNNYKATLEIINNNEIKVIFDEPQRAITKGQSVVLYDDNETCLGGGIIEKII